MEPEEKKTYQRGEGRELPQGSPAGVPLPESEFDSSDEEQATLTTVVIRLPADHYSGAAEEPALTCVVAERSLVSPVQKQPERRSPTAVVTGGADGGGGTIRADGACSFPAAPIIVVAPRKIHNVTGAQVYLSCEVKAVPTPSISWRKVTESPKGIKLFEDLPGDRVNVAVQVRGGPSRHESTGWVLINPLVKEDEGTYQCHATNMVGETYADGIIKVTEHGKIRKTNHGGSESKV
ncbi:hypothetical protein FKM82_000778 [Ascaphus truei]